MTGCYPDLVGVQGVIRTDENDSWGCFLPSGPTLPEMLKHAGYKTAIIGKWHLGLESPNLPNERGFDFFHGFLGDMMGDYWTHIRNEQNYMRLNEHVINPQGHATDLFSQWAVDYLTSAKSSKNPFFLYLAYNAPHTPIQPPREWYQKVLKREPGIDSLRAKYIALIEHLDYGIGTVMEALDKSRLAENTIVVFTSDNGGYLPSKASNGNLHGGKEDMYEGGIKEPTCVVWPKQIKADTQTNSLALTMDFYPTFCDIAGLKVSPKLDGISLLPALRGETQDTNNRIVYWMRREGGKYGGMIYYAVRKGPFKLLQNSPFEPMQLFNIETDPMEQHPLSAASEEFKQLKSQLALHIRKSGRIPWQK
jgi:arylsulfatase A-like enzyme